MSETEAALAELNQDEDGNPLGQLTPEIQAEIDRFNGEMLDTRRRLRDVQFQLTEDIDQLGANLKAINTGMVPVLLTIFALLAHYRRLSVVVRPDRQRRVRFLFISCLGAQGRFTEIWVPSPSLLRIISSPP